jgi:RNA polymerase sigma-70 factor (ECF subfamily)
MHPVVAAGAVWHIALMVGAGTDEAKRQRLAAALQRVAQQDEAALEEVYVATHTKLFGICLRISKDREEAEDALQEVYVTVWRRAASFDPARASPITWLATLTRNSAIDRHRSSARSRSTVPIEAALEMPDGNKGAFALASESQDRARLAHCLEQLDQRQSSAIRSAFLDGATYTDLANREQVPLGTMKSWIRRGLLLLRDCLS